MKVRTATVDDAARILAWMQANAASGFTVGDAEALSNPLTTVFCCENGKTVGYFPVQLVGLLLPMGFRPDSAPEERKEATMAALNAIIEEAKKAGIGELVFYSDDAKAAARAQEWGFVAIPGTILRKALP